MNPFRAHNPGARKHLFCESEHQACRLLEIMGQDPAEWSVERYLSPCTGTRPEVLVLVAPWREWSAAEKQWLAEVIEPKRSMAREFLLL